MTAFESAKEMGYVALVEKINAVSLMEYGLCPELFMDRVFRANENPEKPFVYAGLNNADVDLALLELLSKDPEKIFDGIDIAGMLTDAGAKFLYLPVNCTALADELRNKAGAHGIILVNDIINVRETEKDLLLHIVTACDLADLALGTYEAGVYVKTGEEPLKKVPADTPVSDLVSLDGAKAVYLGYRLYTPEEAKALTAKDAGSALIRVLTEKDCIVDETARRLLLDRTASCGKCVFCREGLIQLEYMQKEITQGRGKAEYIDLTQEIGSVMGDSTLCTVGQVSADIPLDAIAKFRSEYDSHIKKNQCPAGVCTSFVHIYIDPQTCTGCGDCLDVCPADCIEGKPKFIHMIDEFDCTKCGKCIEACEEGAVQQTSGKLPKLPDRLTKVGKFKKH